MDSTTLAIIIGGAITAAVVALGIILIRRIKPTDGK